jgi:3-hydroxybutyrate dehydrogenase
MLRGGTAIITGSTSGIGLAVAEALGHAGCNIVVNGMGDPEKINQLLKHLASRFSAGVFYHRADLSRVEDCEALVRDTQQQFGSVDILVNNAGIQHVAPVEQFPPEKWDAILAINLSAAFHTARTALPLMRGQGWGRIVNIASVHGLVASTHKAAYVAAKHGLIGLTKVIALEVANENITCNAICPGFVLTPLIEQQLADRVQDGNIDLEEAKRELLKEKQPSGQFVTVEQIAALALFLCGEESASINGAALPIDGGWVAQ